MSTDRDVDRIVRSWMDEGVTQLPDRVLDLVLDQIPATPQRRHWWPARRSLNMNTTVRLSIGAAVLVLAAIVGIKLLAGPNVGVPSQTTAPTPSPTPQTVPLSRDAQPGALEPGTYRILGQASEEMVATLPAGWFANSYSRGGGAYTDQVASLSISTVGSLVADGCSGAVLEPPIGPTVDELVAALRALPIVQISAPVGITLDGYQGKQIDLTYLGGLVGSSCDAGYFNLWRTPPVRGESWGVVIPNGWRSTLRILDVGGLRWVVTTSYRLNARDEVEQELGQIVDSIKLEP